MWRWRTKKEKERLGEVVVDLVTDDGVIEDCVTDDGSDVEAEEKKPKLKGSLESKNKKQNN